MRKLTPREKILLAALAFVVINVVGFAGLIGPGISYWNSQRQAYANAAGEYQAAAAAVADSASYQKQAADLESRKASSQSPFYTFADESAMDEYLDTLLEGLTRQYSAAFQILDSDDVTLAGGKVAASRIDIAAAGSQADLMAVVDRLQTAEGPLALSDWDLQSGGDQWTLSARVILYRYVKTGE